MTRRLDPGRALAQLDRHRSGNPNDPPPPPPTLDESMAALGVTVAQALVGAEVGMRRIAEAARGWRLGGVTDIGLRTPPRVARTEVN